VHNINPHLTIASIAGVPETYLVAVATSASHHAGYEWGSVADFVKAVSIINAQGELVCQEQIAHKLVKIIHKNSKVMLIVD
jgi:hypothetical protein